VIPRGFFATDGAPMHTDRKSRRAFTLIEMIAVVVILGVMAGAAAWSFRSSIESASARDVIEQIRFLDSTARQRAMRIGRPVEIVFDVSESALVRREGKRSEESLRTTLPRGYRIEQVNVSGRGMFDGEAAIVCSARGQSASYALRVVGPQMDQWLLFAGMSGQVSFIDGKNESTVLDILAGTGASRGRATAAR
jgi:prepilin-type N-terminal cleavage/methylation domain-containing protein